MTTRVGHYLPVPAGCHGCLKKATFHVRNRALWQIDAILLNAETDRAGRFGVHPAAAAPERLTPAKPAPNFQSRDSLARHPANGNLRFAHF